MNTTPETGHAPTLDALLTTEQVAELLHMAPGTLVNQRHRNQGPPYVKIGNRVLYKARDLQAWLETHTHRP